MNVAIAAMIAGRLRSRRRDHAVTRIHDSILLEFSENMRYIGIPDPQNEVYWYGIEIWTPNMRYWYIWPYFGKVRYFGMKP